MPATRTAKATFGETLDRRYRPAYDFEERARVEEEAYMLTVGQPAPDFTVRSHEGKTISLRDFRGKKLLLWFFPKADTPG